MDSLKRREVDIGFGSPRGEASSVGKKDRRPSCDFIHRSDALYICRDEMPMGMLAASGAASLRCAGAVLGDNGGSKFFKDLVSCMFSNASSGVELVRG